MSYRKCEKCHLFDANIRHIGISREKNLWSTISLEINTCHNQKLQKKSKNLLRQYPRKSSTLEK